VPRIPLATYRVQLHAGFGFDEAAEIASYLRDLGISHVYSSPYLQAAPGSTHGYDIVDHLKVNDELGGADAHERFSMRVGACGLGQVLDIVPNHMAISGRRNRYWWDVLENGRSSRYAAYFDIDWQPHEEKLRNKLLIPILGDHYGRVLSRGELHIERQKGDFCVHYFEHELPLAPESVAPLLAATAADTGSDYLGFLADSLKTLQGTPARNEANATGRERDREVVGALLERLLEETPFIAQALDRKIDALNKSPNKLDAILERQHYRLAFWRAAQEDLGYRRFFDVNTLVGLRVEDPKVFAETHALLLRWLRDGVLDGIRIDHPDGLRDPRRYFERLRDQASDVWIVAEKIIEPGERFRDEWPINGTTGYGYLNQAGGLFVDQANAAEMTRIYADFTGEPTDYAAVCRDKKHQVLRELLGSDVNRLTALFSDICEYHRDRRDYTRHDVLRSLRELVACFPVYRTYVVPERDEIAADDERYIAEAVEAAKRNRLELDADLFDFFGDVLRLRVRGALESEFVMRFQQFTGPVMAKGVEDSAFYCFNRLVSLNEVGGDPGLFGTSPKDFHRYCARVQKTRPHTMLASSTHDTKRSEDVRARISLLSEIPEAWEQAIARWSTVNARHRTSGWPDANAEYLLYQTMVGAWPLDQDRLQAYMQKACREAKQHTSWVSPDEQYEGAMRKFVDSLYASDAFRRDLKEFVRPLVEPGRTNSLSQVLLKLTSPGIPDMYQGSELWDLSLVDPDNRRPVDYTLRRELLSEVGRLSIGQLRARADEGLPKLWTLYHGLRTRREHPAAFGTGGSYKPLFAKGAQAEHVIGYLRGEEVIAIVPRLVLKLNNEWQDTTLDIPSGSWRNELTGVKVNEGSARISDIFGDFPVALLAKH